MKAFIYIIFISLTLLSCQGKKQADAHGHAHESTQENSSEQNDPHQHGNAPTTPATSKQSIVGQTIHLRTEQIDVMNIQLGKFSKIDLSQTITANGNLAVPPQKQANLSTLLAGKVTDVLVIEGDEVEKGQILAYLQNPEFIDLQEKYLLLKNQFPTAKSEFERQEALQKDQINSTRSYEKAKQDFLNIKVSLEAKSQELKAFSISMEKLNQGKIQSLIPVVAPISGSVHLVEINIGMYIERGVEMFEIVNNEHLHIDLLVYEKDLYQLQINQKVMFSLASSPDSIYEASIFSIGKAFESSPRAVRVHAEMHNKQKRLLPGMFVDARIIVGKSQNSLAVPEDAVISKGGLDYIFVKKGVHEGSNNEIEFAMIEVSAGIRDIGFVEVAPSIRLDETTEIVTKGAFYLFAELEKGNLEHHH